VSLSSPSWCNHCDEPVTTGPVTGLTFHRDTGLELCADGEHVAAPTASDPAMRRAAAAIAADYPDYVVAWYLTHFGARPRDFPGAVPVEAHTEAEMRERLDARRRVRFLP
jgi:hypothetical protein